MLTNNEMPELPKPTKLRRQMRSNGAYEMVAAYTDQEMHDYARAVLAAAKAKPVQQCRHPQCLTSTGCAGPCNPQIATVSAAQAKSSTTCQTYGHWVDAPCAECNAVDPQAESGPAVALLAQIERYTEQADRRAAIAAALAAERERALEDAAQWVQDRRDAFCEEHGHIDPDTGALEFGRGQHAEAKSEYVGELEEIFCGIRALKAKEAP